jgi:hypothetical protein
MLAVGVTTFGFLSFDGQSQEGWSWRQFGGVLNSFEDCLESVTCQDLFLLVCFFDKVFGAQTSLSNPLFDAPSFEAADPLWAIGANPIPTFVPTIFRASSTGTAACTSRLIRRLHSFVFHIDDDGRGRWLATSLAWFFRRRLALGRSPLPCDLDGGVGWIRLGFRVVRRRSGLFRWFLAYWRIIQRD